MASTNKSVKRMLHRLVRIKVKKWHIVDASTTEEQTPGCGVNGQTDAVNSRCYYKEISIKSDSHFVIGWAERYSLFILPSFGLRRA